MLNKIKGTLVGVAAVSTTVALTNGLKDATDRERPNGDDSELPFGAHIFFCGSHASGVAQPSVDRHERRLAAYLRYRFDGPDYRHFMGAHRSGLALSIGHTVQHGVGDFIASFVNDAFLGLQNDESGATVSASVVRDGAVVHWSWRF